MFSYFATLNWSRKVLWSHLIWWLHTLVWHFEPHPRLWLTSVGLSAIIGTVLLLSTRTSSKGTTRLESWQIFRLYLMPFCVSSFSALVKDEHFLLIFPPSWVENTSGAACILAFWILTWLLARRRMADAALAEKHKLQTEPSA